MIFKNSLKITRAFRRVQYERIFKYHELCKSLTDQLRSRDYNLLLRCNKIPLNAIDLSTRLWGNKSHKLCSYFLEPCTEVFCFGLNFNIRASKLVYCWSLHTIAHLIQDWTGKITKARALICSAVQIKSY